MSERHNQAAEGVNRRGTTRVRGPFMGRRRGALTTDLRIHDLSVGGCLIESFHEVAPGRQLRLDIELPYEGWLTLDAETLYNRVDYGFAVKFVNLSAEALATLERTIARLQGTDDK